MIERVHDHIMKELQQNTRTDTVFILTAILLNLLALGINSAVSGQNNKDIVTWIVFASLVGLVLIINLVAIVGLLRGKETRTKLLNGVLKMYKDQGVEGYYDPAVLGNYSTRYNLFLIAVVFTGLISILIPSVLILD